jgi:hypothetical protein
MKTEEESLKEKGEIKKNREGSRKRKGKGRVKEKEVRGKKTELRSK